MDALALGAPLLASVGEMPLGPRRGAALLGPAPEECLLPAVSPDSTVVDRIRALDDVLFFNATDRVGDPALLGPGDPTGVDPGRVDLAGVWFASGVRVPPGQLQRALRGQNVIGDPDSLGRGPLTFIGVDLVNPLPDRFGRDESFAITLFTDANGLPTDNTLLTPPGFENPNANRQNRIDILVDDGFLGRTDLTATGGFYNQQADSIFVLEKSGTGGLLITTTRSMGDDFSIATFQTVGEGPAISDFVGGSLAIREQLPLDGVLQTGLECGSLRVNTQDITIDGTTYPITATLVLQGPAFDALPEGEVPGLNVVLQAEGVREALAFAVNAERLAQTDALIARFGIPAAQPIRFTDIFATHEFDPEAAAALLEEAGWVDRDGDGIRELDVTPAFDRLNGLSTNLVGDLGPWEGHLLGWPACGLDGIRSATTDACVYLDPRVIGLVVGPDLFDPQEPILLPRTDDEFANCTLFRPDRTPALFLSVSRHLVDLAEAEDAVAGFGDRGCTVTTTIAEDTRIAALQTCPDPAAAGVFDWRGDVATYTLVFGDTPEAERRAIALSEAVRVSLQPDGTGPIWQDDSDGDGLPWIDDDDWDNDGTLNHLDRHPLIGWSR
jgi:hypothetical protein